MRDIEGRVLSALMQIEGHKCDKVLSAMLMLDETLFRWHESKSLFAFIKYYYDASRPFDVISLMNHVPTDCYDYFSKVADIQLNSNMLEKDVQSLVDIRQAQKMQDSVSLMTSALKSTTAPLQVMNVITQWAENVCTLGMEERDYTSTPEQLAERFLDNTYIPGGELIRTGISLIDNLNDGGVRNSSMITIAGRSGMGKTGFSVYLAHNIAKHHYKKGVLFFSLEMTDLDIYGKQIAVIAGQSVSRLTNSEKSAAVAASFEIPFHIDRKPLATIDYICNASRRHSRQHQLGVIVVDYLGVVQNKDKSLDTHVLRQADISNRLAALALELNCVVIALSQVNRDYANREDKCPITSDAADSSGSERSSTLWLGIHRPEVDDQENPYYKNKFIVKCRKNRFGKPWTAVFGFEEGIFMPLHSGWNDNKSSDFKSFKENYRK